MNESNFNKDQFQTLTPQTTHILPSLQNQYISQFLVFKDQENNSPLQCQEIDKVGSQESMVSLDSKNDQVKEETAQKSLEDEDEIYEETTPFQDSEEIESKPKRSPLHNFQKHFVTTIRRSVRFTWPKDPSETLKLAKEMWQTFKNSHKYTKQFVSLILGQSSSSSNQKMLKKYNLLEYVSKYPAGTLPKAQRYLKQKVLETFRELPKQKIMYERRIQKKEQFANYLFKVLGEIQNGVMNKRLPKRKRGCGRNSLTKAKLIEENTHN